MLASGESKGTPKPTQSGRKTRVSLACKRCNRRKQRCDGGHPVCKSCERAGTPCIYERPIRPQYPGGKSLYINALEERIAFLEAHLPAHAEDHFQSNSSKMEITSDRMSPTIACHPGSDSHSSRQSSFSEPADTEETTSLVDGVAYLSLRASGTTDTAPEPFYLGESSGAAIARMIQTSIFKGSRTRNLSPGSEPLQPQPVRISHPYMAPRTYVTPHGDLISEFPPYDQAHLLFRTFFDRLHTRWPLLDRKEYTALFDLQYSQGALTIMQRSIMHLIYAIAARFLQLTRTPCGVDSEKHLMAAIEPMDYILEQHNLGTAQFLLLLGLHGQRSPYGAGAWSQVRYAVSLCIELGLHRESRPGSTSHSPRDLEIRRRAFWSCYGLDRGTSVILGRAFSIADRDIDVQMPSLSPEFRDLTHEDMPGSPNAASWSNIEPFIHIIKLERIQSRIQRTVFRVDKDVFSGRPEERARLDQKMANMRQDLDQWVETAPQLPKDAKNITWMYDPESANYDSHDFYNLQYQKSILSLFTILLPTLDTSDERFVATARSAASVCIAYKRLNQQRTLTYTMISLHSCFVAGLTLVYCLWRNRTLFGYDVIEAVQACSQSLTIFGEKWAGAVKYRDIFDALSGSLFKTLVLPGSSSKMVELQMPSVGEQQKPRRKSGAAVCAPGSSPNEMRSSHQSSHAPNSKDKPGMSELVSDAVKEAFMEVDEEAPGGWQGWRMWNEMLGDGSAEMCPPTHDSPWDPQELGEGINYEPTTMPDVTQVDDFETANMNEWHFGTEGSEIVGSI